MVPPTTAKHCRTQELIDDDATQDFIDNDADSVRSSGTWAPGPSSPATLSMYGSVPRSQPSQIPVDSEESSLNPPHRPLRRSAVNAASPMRKHARIDLGYVSDIAEAYDSEDEDELDGEGIEDDPLDTQMDDAPFDIPECQDVGDLDEPEPEYNGRFAQFASHIETLGFLPLIDAARMDEYKSGSTYGSVLTKKDVQIFWTDMSFQTLCSMPERVVIELISGNLKQAYDSDVDLRQTLDGFEELAKSHPCIYTRSLTTADGQPMTIVQARRLVKWLQRYVSDDPEIEEHLTCREAFRRIDAEFGSKWARANPSATRAYLSSKASSRLECRVDNVLLFCQQLLAECARCEAEKIPLKPLTYIGYAAKADRRKRQHEACGKSSNWLATLVQATCNVLWGRGVFKMHFMVICLLAHSRQGMIAEMLLTRISRAYYNMGGGFCIDVAGKSMESLRFQDKNHLRWHAYRNSVDSNTPLVANLQLQQTRLSHFLAEQSTGDNLVLEDVLSRIRLAQTICRCLRDHPKFQDEEWLSMVKTVDDLWELVRVEFPQYE